MALFKDTHPAIIDQETFDLVQKIRKHKRVRTKYTDTVNLFTGLVYCSDCGNKHYFCTQKKDRLNLDHYTCSRYKKRINRCENAHYIRKIVLEELVLTQLQRLVKHISKHESEFIEKLKQKHELNNSKELATQKQQLFDAKKRYEELDTIIKHLYEDSLTGKLSSARFKKLSDDYESEQAELSAITSRLEQFLRDSSEQTKDISAFVQHVKKYTAVTALTPAMVAELIEKNVIYAPVKTKAGRTQQVDLYYRFVGTLDDLL